MNYQIGDLAKMMNLSTQMIRYYEKCGVITPERTDGNYRVFSTMDFFALAEAIGLSRFNIPIKDKSAFDFSFAVYG